jgi:hypothetical protein
LGNFHALLIRLPTPVEGKQNAYLAASIRASSALWPEALHASCRMPDTNQISQRGLKT